MLSIVLWNTVVIVEDVELFSSFSVLWTAVDAVIQFIFFQYELTEPFQSAWLDNVPWLPMVEEQVEDPASLRTGVS